METPSLLCAAFWGHPGCGTAAWVAVRQDAVGSRVEGLGTWQSQGLLLPGGCSQLEKWKVQTGAGQVPAQPCLQVCCSLPQQMTFLESRQPTPERVKSRVPCALGAPPGGRSASPFVCLYRSCLQLGLPKKREGNCSDWWDSLYAMGVLTHGGQLGSVGRAVFSCRW